MKEYIRIRVCEMADYITETASTVRQTAHKFNVSKSTVHKDVAERLEGIDKERFIAVRKILNANLLERHIRGGAATKEKYKIKKT